MDVRDVRERSSAKLRHLGGEEEIRRAADGNGVQAGSAQVAAKSGEDLLFVAKIAVGKKNYVAQRSGSLRFPHDVEQGRQHFRAAASLEILHILAGPGQVVRRGRQRLRRKFLIAVVERENTEAIGGTETVQSLEQGFASLLDGSAAHGARYVNHIKHFDWHALARGHRGRKSSEQELCFARIACR